MSDDLFRPVGPPWQRVSPALTKALRILCVLPLLLLAVVLAVLGVLLPVPSVVSWVLLGAAAATVLGAAWTWSWADRSRRAVGYAEQEDDLIVSSGVMFRRLVAVPYGRMQFVDVSADPLERWLGIATVTLHTASTETAAEIPGLPAEEATRLRNRLTELGESRGSGV
ncbi:hypothetical protein ASD11_08620 [Aeromicrobium sp. Root495]|uniref:PH domain-containing protein n=1 Tax=Aeromicrobium sp. Root495 TaxID=1736550 RepID=UPI00070038CA|nr:PH domain-containing protein [Aeromicrobium sp. Root495]KQY59605.1 hypothetical protein ASD11_08620 [Aeromicrobium sp. Root495]